MTVILLDFFGTLVDYDPSRTTQGYYRTHELVREMQVDVDYAAFLLGWSAVAARFDATSDVDDREFSMRDVGRAYLRDATRTEPSLEDVDRLVASYLAEWNQGVHPVEGVTRLLAHLASEHRLAVVTNTHDPRLVPDHLEAIGIADHFAAVITSVEVGWRKPHPRIYEVALDALGASPADAVFVGDSKEPDYDGPRAAGIRALLIDPHELHSDLDPADRLESVLDLPDRIR